MGSNKMYPAATRLRPVPRCIREVKGLALKAVTLLSLVQASDQATEFLSLHTPPPTPAWCQG